MSKYTQPLCARPGCTQRASGQSRYCSTACMRHDSPAWVWKQCEHPDCQNGHWAKRWDVERGRGRYCSPSCARLATGESRRVAIAERFWEKVAIVDDAESCWLWQAGTSGGYGMIKYKGRHHEAHRIAYMLTYGEIPDGLFVLHRCDVPACCRPEHLFLGTQADNMEDRRDKGRHPHGETHPLSKLTESDVRTIRQLHKAGWSMNRLAKRFDVTSANISAIVKRKTWTHVE